MSVSAKYFRARLGTTVLSGTTDFEDSGSADDLDATDAESNGYGATDAGVIQHEITLNGNHIIGSSPWGVLTEGVTLTNLKIYLQSPSGVSLTGPNIVFASATVLEYRDKGAVRGKLEWSCRVKSNGAIVRNLS